MMFSITPFRIAIVCCCPLGLLGGSAYSAGASEQNASNSQAVYQLPISASTRLQVTGSGDSLTLDTERADVQSTLKAVMKQAGKQFAPDANVTGSITLLLTDQPLETVLRALCDQCYLKYTANPSGIYRFTRDDEAIKKAFNRLKELNGQLRAQLRSMGLDIPSDDVLADNRPRAAPAGVPGSFGLSAGGPRSSQDAAKADRQRPSVQNGVLNQSAPVTTESSLSAPASKTAGSTQALKKDAAVNKVENIHTDFIPQGDVYQFLGQAQRASGVQDYSLFLRQNGLVWFNIPEEKPLAVASVLQLFSQQSNVPILVDQSIPSSLKFRVWGNLSPRQLPEALNVLAPTAHLQWRWIGGSVFVVPAPNFMVSFGDQGAAFRSQYPAQPRGENSPSESREKRGGQQ